MKKRFLSILLALVMVLGMFPTVAFAAEGESASQGTWGGIDWTLTADGTLDAIVAKYISAE